MKWAKAQLNKYRHEPLTFETTLDLADVARERFSDMILDVSALQVNGWVRLIEHDDVLLHATVTGDVTVPSSRSLTPVVLPVDLTIDEQYLDDEARLVEFDETDAVFLLENNTVVLDDSVLENLVASLPLQILTPAEAQSDADLPSGQDWTVLSETDAQAAQRLAQEDEKAALDPRLAALDDFFLEDDKK